MRGLAGTSLFAPSLSKKVSRGGRLLRSNVFGACAAASLKGFVYTRALGLQGVWSCLPFRAVRGLVALAPRLQGIWSCSPSPATRGLVALALTVAGSFLRSLFRSQGICGPSATARSQRIRRFHFERPGDFSLPILIDGVRMYASSVILLNALFCAGVLFCNLDSARFRLRHGQALCMPVRISLPASS